MSSVPYIELGFAPTGLRPRDLPRSGAFLGHPSDAIEAALAVTRAAVVDEMRNSIRGIAEPTVGKVLEIADLAWATVFWKFRKISAPVMADAYVRAYRAAQAGDVPMSIIYDLADKHAEKIGEYFHESSRQALADGFNTLVNRRLPAKAAADRVLDAYGLAPRQMRGYVSNQQLFLPVTDPMPRSLKAKARVYIDKSFTTRVRKLSLQEEHNIDEQAKQLAWMWLQDKGRVGPYAQKMWITAKDERTCGVCAPLHGKKVALNEQFMTKEGAFWTPGLHPNCRCVVRLIENRFTVQKDLAAGDLMEFNREHPRGYHGQFSTKHRTKPVKVKDWDEEFYRLMTAQPTSHIRYGPPQVDQATQEKFQAMVEAFTPKTDVATDEKFRAIVEAQTEAPKTGAFVSAFTNTPVVNLIGEQPDLDSRNALALQAQIAAEVARPKAKVQFINEAEVALEALPKTAPDTVKPPKIPLGTTAYAVVGPEQFFKTEDGTIDTTRVRMDGLQFETNRQMALNKAAEEIQYNVTRATRKALKEGAVFRRVDPRTGFVKAELTPDQVAEVIRHFASTATAPPHSPDRGGKSGLMLDLVSDLPGTPGARGDFMARQSISYNRLGHFLGINEDDFKVYVLAVDEGFDQQHTDHGSTEHVGGGLYADEDQVFELTGEFVPSGPEERVPGWAIGEREIEQGTEEADEMPSPWAVTTIKFTPNVQE